MNIFRRLLIGVSTLLFVGTTGFLGWANVRAQTATDSAVAVLQENDVEREDGQLVFHPPAPAEKGFIYYPGGLVDPEAYAVTAQGIADAGYLVVVPKLPLNLAFTDINRAAEIQAQFPKIRSWSIGGHSLGGAMAAEFAVNNVEQVEGLVLLASYREPSADFADFPIPILSIIGTADPGSVEQRAFYEEISEWADLALIEGGNHRQYGSYAFQADDGVATISEAEQQRQIVEAVIGFLDGLE